MSPLLIDMGGRGEPLLFAHANGYPPGSYRQLLDRLAPRFAITAIEHRPLWGSREPPTRLRWTLFARDMLDAIQAKNGQRYWVLGHSMGACIAALAAQQQPELFKGLLLMDPVILPTRFLLLSRLVPRRQMRKMPMIQRALNRPEYFASHDEAFSFYRPKRAFRSFSDEALHDFVRASKQETQDGRLQLRYSGAWEAEVYASAPRMRSALRNIELPTLGLRGRSSDTLRHDVWERWQHWQPRARFTEVPGGHLFPLEHPAAAAGEVIDYVFPD